MGISGQRCGPSNGTDTKIHPRFGDVYKRQLQEQFSPQEYGVASALGNEELAAEIDRVIGAMKDDGRLAALQEKWGI